jgi:ABC-2 type transport system permease protein
LLTALTISREWERGTMEQLIATPVKTPELIIGKLVPYFIIGMIDMVISVLMAIFLFHVPLKGSVTLMAILSCIFLIGGVCQGMLISIIAKNSQALASQIALLSTFLPAFLLSGFIFSIVNMPRPLQLVTYIIPARYFVAILKGIFMKGSGIGLLWQETLLLTVYGLIVFIAANRRFQKRID